jgi:hypothetical protein
MDPNYIPSLEEANMNQAADRIMNLDIFCKKNERYTLKYIPNANVSVKN